MGKWRGKGVFFSHTPPLPAGRIPANRPRDRFRSAGRSWIVVDRPMNMLGYLVVEETPQGERIAATIAFLRWLLRIYGWTVCRATRLYHRVYEAIPRPDPYGTIRIPFTPFWSGERIQWIDDRFPPTAVPHCRECGEQLESHAGRGWKYFHEHVLSGPYPNPLPHRCRLVNIAFERDGTPVASAPDLLEEHSTRIDGGNLIWSPFIYANPPTPHPDPVAERQYWYGGEITNTRPSWIVSDPSIASLEPGLIVPGQDGARIIPATPSPAE